MERLGVECIDLYQIHALDDPQDLKIIMGPEDALEAMKEAKEKWFDKIHRNNKSQAAYPN